MEKRTIETARTRARLGPRDRVGAWFYTGPAGRLVSFSIDLGLSLGALAVWSARKTWRRIRPGHSSAA
jgi:hypothetical protein